MLLAIDLLIAFTLLEALVLWLWHRAGRGGVAPQSLLPNMGAGLCLMAALRCSLAGADWPWIAAWVCGSGLAHAWDLKRRWQRRPSDAAGVLKSRSAPDEVENQHARRSERDPSPTPPSTRVQVR